MQTYNTTDPAIALCVDEELVIQAPALSNLGTQTNSLCFINRLPTETLTDIFIQGARSYYNTALGQLTLTAPSWVNISYVNRHWRNVALNCPTLWSYVFITSPRWTKELLARSQQVSLKLNVNLIRPDEKEVDVNFVEQVTNHLERIQELRIILTFSNYQLLSKFSSRAPRLQHLSISLGSHPVEWSPEPLLFGGETPALRTLDLVVCPAPWYALKLSGVTTLSLRSVPAQFQQDTGEFLTTLSAMQNLTYLDLDNALASATGFLSSPAFHRFEKFELPYLSRLSISAPLSTVVAFLSCVDVPLKTEIHLALNFRDEHAPHPLDDNIPMLRSLLARRFAMSQAQAPFIPTIRSLLVAYSNHGVAKAVFCTSGRGCDTFIPVNRNIWNHNIPLQIFFLYNLSELTNDLFRTISYICCPIPLPGIQRLLILDPPFSPVFWTHILGRLQGLRCLKLSEGRMPVFPSTFFVPTHDSTANFGGNVSRDPDQTLAPALEELELCNIEFPTTPEKYVDPLKHPDVQSLCGALSTRGKPRGRLTMTQCAFTERASGEEKVFDMAGWWEDGCFHVLDEHDSEKSLG